MAPPIVEIKQGKLKGIIRNDIEGGQYYSFRGIPYAEPPVGKLRFKDPGPLESWTGIREALEESKCSAQYNQSSGMLEGGDDCLYLDVASTSLNAKRPVMVWIHGGAFLMGSNTYKSYSPDYLLTKEIVFVSINYRLGVLGFLNMEHEECAGNQGLKDQIAALKWIKENIDVFGGDPENVTIFGGSAGGASVHALCLSSQAKGFFHKAIIQSCVISSCHRPSNKEYGYSLAKALGKDCSNAMEIIEFLRTIPALQLVETNENINKMELSKLILNLVPTPDSNNLDSIFPQSINKKVMDGIDVPVIIGYNSHEGILRLLGYNISDLVKELNDNFEAFIAEYLIYDIENASKIAKPVREFYFGKDKINENQIDEIVQFFGDFLLVYQILEVADIQMQKTSSTYLYKFSYRSDFPTMKDILNIKVEGTSHGDELGCLFYSEMQRKKLPDGSRDRIAMERLTTMWTNFAKTGDPTPVTDKLITTKWQPIEKTKKNYLEINDNLTAGENPDIKIWNLWRPLFQMG